MLDSLPELDTEIEVTLIPYVDDPGDDIKPGEDEEPTSYECEECEAGVCSFEAYECIACDKVLCEACLPDEFHICEQPELEPEVEMEIREEIQL